MGYTVTPSGVTRAQAHQAAAARAESPQRLALDDRFGAAPTDPALHVAVRCDQGLVAGAGRGRPLAAHDGRQGKGLAGLP
jgi:hypothetical protein